MESKKSSLLNRYEDPTGEFSNRSLQMATWYARHHDTIKKSVMVFLIVWSVLTLGISLFAVGKYFIFDYARDQENLNSLSVSYVSRAALERLEPQDLVIASPTVFSGIENRYDFSVVAANPNASWIATVTYRFEYAGGSTAESQVVILPKQERPILVFGHEVSTRPNSVEFNVISVSWKRIDPHYIADASEYINDRINVTIDNFKYVSGSTSNGQNGPMVEFLVTNHSLFDFWEFSGMLEFTRDGQIIGYSPLVIPQFKGGETRVVSLGILSSISLIHSVELIPSVNVFDPNVFMIQ